MLRFNTFFTVILTFFAFLLALGGGMLTAIQLSAPLALEAVLTPGVEPEPRSFPGQPSRVRVSLTAPISPYSDLADAPLLVARAKHRPVVQSRAFTCSDLLFSRSSVLFLETGSSLRPCA